MLAGQVEIASFAIAVYFKRAARSAMSACDGRFKIKFAYPKKEICTNFIEIN